MCLPTPRLYRPAEQADLMEALKFLVLRSVQRRQIGVGVWATPVSRVAAPGDVVLALSQGIHA